MKCDVDEERGQGYTDPRDSLVWRLSSRPRCVKDGAWKEDKKKKEEKKTAKYRELCAVCNNITCRPEHDELPLFGASSSAVKAVFEHADLFLPETGYTFPHRSS